MRQTITPVVGLPEFRGWAQVVANQSQSLVCAVAVEGVDAGSVGAELGSNIQTVDLSSAAELHQLLEDLQEVAKESNVKLYLAASLHLSEGTVLAAYHGSVLLKKSQKVGQLMVADDQLQIVTGKLDEEDVVVLLTKHAGIFGEEITQKLNQGYDVDTIITSLVPGVHASSMTALVSIAFIQLAQFRSVVATSPVETLEQEPEAPDKQTQPADEAFARDLESEIPNLNLPSLNEELPLAKQALPKVELNFSRYGEYLTKLRELVMKLVHRLKLSASHVEFKKPAFQLRMFSREVYVGQTQNRRELIKKAGVGIVLLGVVLVFLLMQFFKIRGQRAQAASIVDPLLAKAEVAMGKLNDDPIFARKELESVLAEFGVAQTKFADQSYALSYLGDKLKIVEAYHQEISGREEFQQLPEFYNLRLAEAEFIASQADLVGNQAAFLDSEKKNLVLFNIDTKEHSLISLASLEQIKDLSFDGEFIYLLADGLYQLKVGETEIKEVKEAGDSNRQAKFMENFGSYLYVFNAEKRNIYRYSPDEEGGYADPVGWLQDKQGLDFEQITSLEIDGDLWLGTSNGQILRYRAGQKQDFVVNGLSVPFESALAVYTQEDFEYLYVLDPHQHRLVVLTKDGEYFKEVESQSLSSATIVIVNEEQKRALAVDGSLVYEIKL